MRKQLSGRGIIVLFVASLIAGVVLRGFVFPPAPTFSGVESKLIGEWHVVDKEEATTTWKFNEQREIKFQDERDATNDWTGSWRLRDPVLDIHNRETVATKAKLDDLQVEVQFAENPNEVTFKFRDGKSLRATRK